MSVSETFKYEGGGLTVDSSNYRKHTSESAVQRAHIERFNRKVGSIIAELAPKTLLDAGCGEGFEMELLQQASPSTLITGFDVMADSVAFAQKRNPQAKVFVGDIYNIEAEDNSFDVVCCLEVLEHLHEPDRGLAELARVAQRAVVLSVPHEPFFCLGNASRGKNLDVRPRGSDPDHRNFWSRSGFGQFAARELNVTTLTGSMPWTIAVGTPKS